MNTDELTAAANRDVEERAAATDELAALLAKIAERHGSTDCLRICREAIAQMQKCRDQKSEVKLFMWAVPKDAKRLGMAGASRLMEFLPEGCILMWDMKPEHRAPIMQYARGLRDADSEVTCLACGARNDP